MPPKRKKTLVDLESLGIDVSPPSGMQETNALLKKESLASQVYRPDDFAFRVVQMPGQNLWKVEMIDLRLCRIPDEAKVNLTDFDQKKITVHMLMHHVSTLVQRDILPSEFKVSSDV